MNLVIALLILLMGFVIGLEVGISMGIRRMKNASKTFEDEISKLRKRRVKK